MSETDPLLGHLTSRPSSEEEELYATPGQDRHENSHISLPTGHQLGVFSGVFLIFNRTIGTGIYATPSLILTSAGSVGLALSLWLIGAAIAACGSAVFVEIGTALPKSGGEKNFLEYFYSKPEFLTTCIFTFYSLITGAPSANSVVFGEYILNAFHIPAEGVHVQLVACLSMTAVVVIHGAFSKTGLVMQNTLGVIKLFVLSALAITGVLSLAGVPWLQVRKEYEQPNNFHWNTFWQGSTSDANRFVTGLYSVIWSFIGYSQVNYVLSEVRNPVQTVKIAAPLALALVTAVYLTVNVAYFAVVSKNDIVHSRTILAALYFRNLFGASTERALSAFIALSVFGNLLAGQFTQGRLIQELGREGILPFSSFFASSAPFGAPLAGLFTQYVVSCIFMLAPPASDAYLFLISTASYSLTLINVMVSTGVLLLYSPWYHSWNWNPPYRTPKLVVLAFFASNIFLACVPLIPPAPGKKVYTHLPYWIHALVSLCVSLIGTSYWYLQVKWRPQRNNYKLVRREIKDDVTGLVTHRVVERVDL